MQWLFRHPPPSMTLPRDVNKRCLIIELWWIGDAVLMTSILQGLLADGWEVTVLGKTQSKRLLEGTYPEVKWILFDAPWTAFHGKYLLWRWPWPTLLRVLGEVRRARFDAAVSIRHDPRDHFLLWIARVPRRVGFPAPFGSTRFLNEIVATSGEVRHRTEDWWLAQLQVSPGATKLYPPRIVPEPALAERYRALFGRDPRPVVAIHGGARNAVRRWPESYLRELILALRAEFDFQFVFFPDTDGFGQELSGLADHTLTGLTLDELVAALSCVRVLMANDSGPGHLADALGVHVVTFLGPGDARIMRPFDKHNLVVMRDICPYHPCSDYCRFPEPYCLTQLTPAMAIREVRRYFQETGLAPARGTSPPASAVAASDQPR